MDSGYRIAVCDDSAADRDYITDLCRRWALQTGSDVQIRGFCSAEDFLFHYAECKEYDFLLLDIEMGDLDGVSLAKKLRQDNRTVQIVFITGFPDFIAQGYEVSAVHYLIKPVGEETLAKVLTRAAANCKKAEKALIFSVDGESVRVDVGEILYAEALSHFCRINMRDGAFEVRRNFSQLEKELGESFIRTHRSYLVRISAIRRIAKTEITLDNGEKVPLSRGSYQAVNQAFIRWFKGEWQ